MVPCGYRPILGHAGPQLRALAHWGHVEGLNRGRCPECPPCWSCCTPCAPQEHGSPSPFWEQELESLHFVIEMKNEHIHSLDKKLLNLETVVG